VALLCATIAFAIGPYAIFTSGASYNNETSTTLRDSTYAHLDHEVVQCDATRRDPLPKYLAKATLMIAKDKEDREGDGEGDGEAPTTGSQETTAITNDRLISSQEERTFSIQGPHTSTW
jgi:hypothetical protein